MLTGDVTGTRPTVSVIIAAFSSERWDPCAEAVASVAAQTSPALETIVVIDHNPALLTRARRELAAVVIPNAGARGASGARNTGVAHSRGDVLAFLDDDARGHEQLARPAAPPFRRPRRGGPAAGSTRCGPPPGRAGSPASSAGQSACPTPACRSGPPAVRNVWAGNMAVRRAAFEAAGGFREDFGKVGASSRPEDTDLCMRVNGGAWLYDPDCVAGHRVPAAAGHRSATSFSGASTRAAARRGSPR